MHRSDAAAKLRQEIFSLVASGRTEHEIVERLKQRYGARILREPDGTAGWVLQIVPTCVLLFGSLAIIRVIVHSRRRAREAGLC